MCARRLSTTALGAYRRRRRPPRVAIRVDVRISIDAERIWKWIGEVMGGRGSEGWHCCLLPRRFRRALVRKRRTAVLIHRIVFVVQSRVHCDIRVSPSNKSPWRMIHATAAGTPRRGEHNRESPLR